MAISIKNKQQIEYMRISGKIVAKTHELLKKELKPGITTFELDKIAEEFILSNDAIPSFKGYQEFPASVCISINEEVIHGIPGSRIIKDGDLISIDIGAYKNGFHGDAARTYIVGEGTEIQRRLVYETEKAFFEGMEYAKDGNHLNDISSCIGDYIEKQGFSIVRDFVGHGIGKDMHESPQIPNYRMKNRGPKLARNMTLAIEPMVNEGTYEVIVLNDGWTVITRDKKCSAHYENTILITDGEPEFLTMI